MVAETIVAKRMPQRETATLHLKLFGGFKLSDGSGDVRLRGDKLKALLAVLASEHPVAQRREFVITLLWGSHADKQARQNLRQALVRLRKAINKDIVTADGDRIGLADGLLTIDVQEFERTVSNRNVESAMVAIDHFDGTFLPDLEVREQLWEEWLSLRREKLDGLAVDAMILVAEHHIRSKQHDAALELGRRALSLDYFREDGHCIVMRALAGLGRRAQALQHYGRLAVDLERELGVGPEKATRACREEIDATQTVGTRIVQVVAKPLSASTDNRNHDGADLPTVAVLPFDNMTAGTRHNYFADGISEEIIAALARLSWFYTIARSSSFLFRNRTINMRHVGRILGARYILEGSVQRRGQRIRITPHLIDANTGTHIWADRFDTSASEIFEVQDLIAARVLAGVVPALQNAEIARAREFRSEDLTAYDCYLQALPHYQGHSATDYENAIQLLEKARARDSNFALSLAMEANCKWRPMVGAWKPLSDTTLKEIFQLAHQATQNGSSDPVVVAKSATVLGLGNREHSASLELCRGALRMAPYHPFVLTSTGWMEVWSGELESAIKHLRFGARLFPCDAGNQDVLTALAAAYFYSGDYQNSLEWAQRACAANRRHAPAFRYKAASHVQLGCMPEARSAMQHCLALQPHCTISMMSRPATMMAKDPSMLEHYFGALRLAGMPS